MYVIINTDMTEKKPRWKSVSIPVEVWEKAKEAIESGELDMYHTPSELIIDAARRRIEELEKIKVVAEEYELSEEDVKRMARMEHTNVANVNGKTLIAVKDRTDGRIYDVFLSRGPRGQLRIFCDGDKSFDCAHVKYVRYIIIPKLNELIEYYRKKKKKEE